MSKKNKTPLNASSFRILLAGSIVLITALSAAGFTYALDTLEKYAVEVSHKKVDSQASNGNIQALQQIKKQLEQDNDILAKVNLLRSNSQFPLIRLVAEVREIAIKNDLSLESFTPTDAAGNAAAPAGNTTTPPATPTTPVAGSPTSGTVSLSITLKAPVSYANLLQFTYDIEQNLPKMKIKGISISAGGSGGTATGQAQASPSNSGQISTEPIIVEMYTN